MSASRDRTGLGTPAAAVSAGLSMVHCCAGPLLLAGVAGVALGAVGEAPANPWLVTVGAVLLLVGADYALRCRTRRARGAGPDGRCPAVPAQPQPPKDIDPSGDVR
ncbi:mercury transporter [Streptomyces sp. WZ.A104]|uniref:mercury transporter n=1 Tax=Streptomyces sp. WZ.A104 TaxID=2023771 RepID=UPI00117CA280|nr:mercury transporter [Streptomyces sp. WZ.A104]